MPIFLFFLIMNTEFKDTEIFSPIVRTAVAVSDTGKVFLFDRDENRILMYAGNGEKLGSFGRKGQGPGEFNYPMGIRIVDGHLFVLDFTGALEFDLDGTFIEKHKTGEMGNTLIPFKSGWVLRASSFDQATKTSTTRYSVLDKSKKEVFFLGEYATPLRVKGFQSGKPTMTFNPAEAHPVFQIDRTGTFLVYKSEKDFPISVYRVFPKFEKLFDITLSDRTHIPFNTDWADKRMDDLQKRMKESGNRLIMELEPDYPEVFPIVQSITISPDNKATVVLWTKAPDHPEVLTYDWTGKQVKMTYPLETLSRIVDIRKKTVLVASYDEENEEYILVKMPLKECESYIKAHPNTEDIEDSVQVMIRG